ncbi:hypothetical protein RWE15_16510 [Virgibacillus halophilus]|uniref:Uncharacterized protein n=2 Tax=Tigheibacillus halophilus TaxID=361280 RepID=A0ABU5C8R1_9BACI|nr:hypothetical protein [Virgibacillus halophilus]
MKKRIASLQPSANDFQNTVMFLPDSLTVKLVFDFPAKRLYIWRPVDGKAGLNMDMPFNIFAYNFDEISKVKVIANDQTIANSKDFSEKEADSVEGKIQFKNLKSLLLEIQLNDIRHTLPFYKSIPGNGNVPVRPLSSAYKQNVGQITESFKILNNIIHGKSLELTIMEPVETTADEQTPLVNEREDAGRGDHHLSKQTVNNSLAVQMTATNDATRQTQSGSSSPKYIETSNKPTDTMDAEQTETRSAFSDFEKFLESNKQKQFGSSRQDDHN